jgi:AraC-like DNA-binding protein
MLSGISEVYLRKIFSSHFGMLPKEYITKKRIDYALRLLSSGQFEIQEISKMCGYSDPCHFSREFKRHVGVSPREYH